MPKPITKRIVYKADGKTYKQFVVSFNDSQNKVLVIDNYFGLHDDRQQNTFKNLCYEVASTLRKNRTFIYTETNGMEAKDLLIMIKRINPVAIVFTDAVSFGKASLDKSEYFCYVRDWKGIPTILTTPWSLWLNDKDYNKGEGNKALIGFNLKHLLAATYGKNPFDIDLELLKIKPKIITDIAAFDVFMDKLENVKLICTDLEGKNLKVITNKIFTIQIGFWHKDRILSYVVPWEHKDHTWTKKELAHIKRRFKKLFMREDLENVLHFGQFDIGQICTALKMQMFGNKVYDIPSGEFALDENYKYAQKIYRGGDWETDGFKPYSLEFVEYRYGIFRPKDMVISKSDRANMSKFSLEEIAEYGGFDIVSPLLIRKAQLQICTDRFFGHKTVENYKTLVIHQLGVMVKTFAFLRNTGIHIDTKNAFSLVAKGNVFTETATKIRNMILETPAGKKANALLMKRSGLQIGGGVFSSTQTAVLSLTKPSHLRTLFFDVMKLEPTKLGKTKDPSTDKSFQSKYKKEVPEVQMFSDYNKVKILKSTFADGIIKIIKHDTDFHLDGRLRPLLGFLYVLTGRLSSTDPNSQNIPTRSDPGFEVHEAMVKSIKKSFSVKHGRLMLGSDFSAHEVRMAGVIAQDPEIRQAFLSANEAIRKFRLTPDKFVEAAAKVLELEGDIHIINVRFFFKQDVDKDHPLRYRIKAIVFGTLYGKLAKSLAKDLGISEAEAKNLIDVMFERWHKLKDWIDDTQKESRENYMVRYPNFRVAHMWANLHDDIWAQRAMDRRSVNYPIQGFSSDIGVVSVYCYKHWVHHNITKQGFNLDAHHINIVHDASYSDIIYEHMPMAIYLTEHAQSTMSMNYYKKHFNFDISIPLSYGIEFGRNWAELKDWNFRLTGYDTKDKKGNDKYVPGLLDMLRDEGKNMDRPYDNVIKDTKFIMDIRKQELEGNPYSMKVTSKTLPSLFKNMVMFREQK